jgi:glutathione S-transferase
MAKSHLDLDGVPLAEFPYLEKWLAKLLARPGFEKGRNFL